MERCVVGPSGHEARRSRAPPRPIEAPQGHAQPRSRPSATGRRREESEGQRRGPHRPGPCALTPSSQLADPRPGHEATGHPAPHNLTGRARRPTPQRSEARGRRRESAEAGHGRTPLALNLPPVQDRNIFWPGVTSLRVLVRPLPVMEFICSRSVRTLGLSSGGDRLWPLYSSPDFEA